MTKSHANEWEHAVSVHKGDEEQDEDSGKWIERGPTIFGNRLGVTQVTGKTANGSDLTWTSRRHRKGLGAHVAHPGEYRPFPTHTQRAIRTQQMIKKGFIWGSPILTGIGTLLFAISNGSQISYHVQPRMMPPFVGHHLYDWIAALLAFIGLWLVLPGQILKWLETINSGFDARVHNWETGEKGQKGKHYPLLKIAAIQPQKLSYWGVSFRVLGALSFAWAATANFINQVLHVPYKPFPKATDWLVYFPYTLAPALLLIGGIFLAWEANHSIWKGFLPTSRKRVKSLAFWINFLGFIAPLGLLAGGICQWNDRKIMLKSGVKGLQMYRAFAYFIGGSVLFFSSQVLILIEISSPHLQ